MPDVTFTIAQRRYTLRCAPGQQEHLRATAAELDRRVNALAAQMKGADDRHLLVLTAIGLLDALEDTAADRREAEALRAWATGVAGRLEGMVAALDQLVT